MKEGWEIKKLKDVCSYDKEIVTNPDLPYVGLEHIESKSGKFVGTLKPTTVKSSTFHFTEKHVLYGRLRPYLNKVFLPFFEGHCSTEIFPISVTTRILREYLYYWFLLDSTVKKIDATRTGARMPRANMTQVSEFEIPIPPLSEQKEIVALLDDVLSRIDKARVNIEKNIENAEEMFQIFLDSILTIVDTEATETSIGDITIKIGSGATPSGGKNAYKKSGISLIRSLNVYDLGFKPDNLAYIDEKQAEKLNNVILQENDILLNITGASLARCCLVPAEYLPARVNQHVSIIRVKENTILPELLHYILISAENKKKLLGIGEKGGSTRQAITKAQIKEYRIKYPTEYNKQNEMLRKISHLKEQTYALKARYTEKLQALDELRNSVLEKAFRGELT